MVKRPFFMGDRVQDTGICSFIKSTWFRSTGFGSKWRDAECLQSERQVWLDGIEVLGSARPVGLMLFQGGFSAKAANGA